MLIALGIIIGLIIGVMVFTIIAFFRSPIENQLHATRRQIENIGTNPKGAIFLPEDENELTRQERIKKNSAEGKDTPLSELR